ncbi:hypothetical protein [Kineosporia sp. A_224]|uniref:hypothetical protein n=1 Tax=Kineosporia sp. A_224 TaxID=1962180 RepID=UPI000B4B301F|nr:hypothetical protein [Kineosporia sp. A_224]
MTGDCRNGETPIEGDPIDLPGLDICDLIAADPRRVFRVAADEFARLVPGAGPVDAKGGA